MLEDTPTRLPSIPRRKAFPIAALILCFMALFSSGCSGFHRAWNQQQVRNSAVNHPQEASIAGAWTGHWESTANGHHGALRCLITAKENHRYQAWYHAKYLKWFSYSYKVEMVVDPLDPLLTFQGQADLGALAGGEYQYQGSVSNQVFRATYQARKDHGIFQMERPGKK